MPSRRNEFQICRNLSFSGNLHSVEISLPIPTDQENLSKIKDIFAFLLHNIVFRAGLAPKDARQPNYRSKEPQFSEIPLEAVDLIINKLKALNPKREALFPIKEPLVVAAQQLKNDLVHNRQHMLEDKAGEQLTFGFDLQRYSSSPNSISTFDSELEDKSEQEQVATVIYPLIETFYTLMFDEKSGVTLIQAGAEIVFSFSIENDSNPMQLIFYIRIGEYSAHYDLPGKVLELTAKCMLDLHNLIKDSNSPLAKDYNFGTELGILEFSFFKEDNQLMMAINRKIDNNPIPVANLSSPVNLRQNKRPRHEP